MTIYDLREFLKKQGVTVSEYRRGVGGAHRDLIFGMGLMDSFLQDLTRKLRERNVAATLEQVTNRTHPDYGKHYIEIKSIWCD